MSDEEVFQIYEDMKKIYKNLPDPDHEPLQFKYYYMLYKNFHVKEKQQ